MINIKKIFPKFKKFIIRFRWLIVIILILALIGSLIIFKPKQQTQYVKASVTRENISETVNESGNIIADSQAEVNSTLEGTVEEIYVINGSYVYSGSPLFKVKSMVSEQAKNNALNTYNQATNTVKQAQETKLTLEAQAKSAKKQMIDAKAAYNVAYIGFRDGLVNPLTGVLYTQFEVNSARAALFAANANFDAAIAKYNGADNTINLAKESEKNALSNYEALLGEVIKSPTNGIVSNLSIAVGDKVTPSNLGVTSKPCLIVADISKLYLQAAFNEIDLPKIKIGQKGYMSFDSIKDKTFEGVINRIDSIGNENQGVVTFNVYIKINNPDTVLNPGMSGDVDIEVEKHENVLTVPSASIKPYQNGKAVQVLELINNEQQLKYLPVEIGIKSIDKTEVVSGLNEGQEIVVSQINNSARSLFSGGN